MTSRIKQKLSSQSGASITFALLLFLVCAVISSVVLTAGTAAAGRMSQMAEMDQRYYSVTSAAKLLSDEFSDRTVTVVKETESASSDTKYYVYGNKENTEDESKKVESVVSGSNITIPSGSELALLKDAAVRVVSDTGFETDDSGVFRYKCDLKLNSVKLSEADVDITESLLKDGTLMLTISKGGYRLRLTFSVATSERTEYPSSTQEDAVKEFTWSLKGIETLTSETGA